MLVKGLVDYFTITVGDTKVEPKDTRLSLDLSAYHFIADTSHFVRKAYCLIKSVIANSTIKSRGVKTTPE